MDMDVVRIAQNHLELIVEEMASCKTEKELVELRNAAVDALESYFNALEANLDD